MPTKFDRIQTFTSYPGTMSINIFILAQLFVFSFAETSNNGTECNIVGVCIVSIFFLVIYIKVTRVGARTLGKNGVDLYVMNWSVSKL